MQARMDSSKAGYIMHRRKPKHFIDIQFWKQRWITATAYKSSNSQAVVKLEFRNEPGETQAIEQVFIEGVTSVNRQTAHGDRFAFCIEHKTGITHLSAHSESLRESWVQFLRRQFGLARRITFEEQIEGGLNVTVVSQSNEVITCTDDLIFTVKPHYLSLYSRMDLRQVFQWPVSKQGFSLTYYIEKFRHPDDFNKLLVMKFETQKITQEVSVTQAQPNTSLTFKFFTDSLFRIVELTNQMIEESKNHDLTVPPNVCLPCQLNERVGRSRANSRLTNSRQYGTDRGSAGDVEPPPRKNSNPIGCDVIYTEVVPQNTRRMSSLDALNRWRGGEFDLLKGPPISNSSEVAVYQAGQIKRDSSVSGTSATSQLKRDSAISTMSNFSADSGARSRGISTLSTLSRQRISIQSVQSNDSAYDASVDESASENPHKQQKRLAATERHRRPSLEDNIDTDAFKPHLRQRSETNSSEDEPSGDIWSKRRLRQKRPEAPTPLQRLQNPAKSDPVVTFDLSQHLKFNNGREDGPASKEIRTSNSKENIYSNPQELITPSRAKLQVDLRKPLTEQDISSETSRESQGPYSASDHSGEGTPTPADIASGSSSTTYAELTPGTVYKDVETTKDTSTNDGEESEKFRDEHNEEATQDAQMVIPGKARLLQQFVTSARLRQDSAVKSVPYLRPLERRRSQSAAGMLLDARLAARKGGGLQHLSTDAKDTLGEKAKDTLGEKAKDTLGEKVNNARLEFTAKV